MASITRNQVEALNAKLAGGFAFDTRHFVVHGEKTAIKRLPMGGNAYAILRLTWNPERERRLTLTGKDQASRGVPLDQCNAYTVETGRWFPCIHVTKAFDEGAFWHSYGLGRWINLGPAQTKRLFSTLQKLSGDIDEARFLAIASGEPDTIAESRPLT